MLVAAVLSLGVPLVQDWSVKNPIAKGWKSIWSIKASASAGAEAHDSSFDLTEEVTGDGDANGLPVNLTLDNLMVDEAQVPGDECKGTVSTQGLPTKADSEEERHMYEALLFVYPSDALTTGMMWSKEFSATGVTSKVTYNYKVEGTEKVKDEDTLKVTGTVKEDGADGLNETGTWWINHAGKIVKFKLDAKNWHVTMGGGLSVDGTLEGTLKP